MFTRVKKPIHVKKNTQEEVGNFHFGNCYSLYSSEPNKKNTMGKKLTEQEIVEHSKDVNQGFDTCSICQGVELMGEMLSVEPDSNNSDLICKECDAKLEDVSKRYPYNSDTSLKRFANKRLRNYTIGEAVTTFKNVRIVTNRQFHNILRDYDNKPYKTGTNTNNSHKEFDSIDEAITFAKLISRSNSYEDYYVANNSNNKYYVVEMNNYNAKDIGVIVSDKF